VICLFTYNEERNIVVGVDFVEHTDNARNYVFKDEDDVVTSV
jgi:hypothetical protein